MTGYTHKNVAIWVQAQDEHYNSSTIRETTIKVIINEITNRKRGLKYSEAFMLVKFIINTQMNIQTNEQTIAS